MLDERSGGSASAGALDALETLVRHLGEELAFFRRRALDAERRLRDALAALAAARPAGSAPGSAVRSTTGGDPDEDARDLRARVAALEAENADLRARVADAAERARAVADRMRFVRQQEQIAGE